MNKKYSLGERLKELVFDNQIKDIEKFCQEIKVGRTDFYRWWSDTTIPSMENAIKLCNAFHCSLDFLTGRSEDDTYTTYKTLPQFCKRLKIVIQEYNTNPYKLSNGAKISRASIYEWLNNTSKASLESCIKIADYLDCSLDYLLTID